jgi:hypothetical protein
VRFKDLVTLTVMFRFIAAATDQSMSIGNITLGGIAWNNIPGINTINTTGVSSVALRGDIRLAVAGNNEQRGFVHIYNITNGDIRSVMKLFEILLKNN